MLVKYSQTKAHCWDRWLNKDNNADIPELDLGVNITHHDAFSITAFDAVELDNSTEKRMSNADGDQDSNGTTSPVLIFGDLEPECKLESVGETQNWNAEAESRVAAILGRQAGSTYHSDDNGPSLSEVIRDYIWPFYSNWLHLVLGPCTRSVEFDRNEHDMITSVTIYIICSKLPEHDVRDKINRYTQLLLPDRYSRDDHVLLEFGEGVSAPSADEFDLISWHDGPIDLKMGDGIMSPVKKGNRGQFGSSGPWLQISDKDVVVYTNEHVVRPGMRHNIKDVITYPERGYLGEVMLSSSQDVDATMESTNPNAQFGNYSFLTDWAVILLKDALKNPIEMPCIKCSAGCHHVNGITHIPARGMGAVVGAGSKRQSREPRVGVYRCPISGDGLPTQLSPGSWGGNKTELHCWSLSCPRGMDKNEWFQHGIGIKGDSGAGVVDCETGLLCGLVVGNTVGLLTSGNRYRKAHIIDMLDVKNDTVKAANEVGALAFETADVIRCSCT